MVTLTFHKSFFNKKYSKSSRKENKIIQYKKNLFFIKPKLHFSLLSEYKNIKNAVKLTALLREEKLLFSASWHISTKLNSQLQVTKHWRINNF